MGNKGRIANSPASICFDCANALGNCPWSAIDPETGHVGFKPVPGWKVEPVERTEMRKNVPTNVRTVRVIQCPQFKPDDPKHGKRNANALSLDAEQEFLEDPDKFLEKYGRFY